MNEGLQPVWLFASGLSAGLLGKAFEQFAAREGGQKLLLGSLSP